VVVYAEDGHEDIPGPHNNFVVVQHSGEFSMYVHIQRETAATVGTVVKAGDQIAQLGNSGQSSEPHLHFAWYQLDAFGRRINRPVIFDGLVTGGASPAPGRAIAGVPIDSLHTRLA
jgi:murein DD-endopeptidase MepM/ murein hydrolase activator NlpD